MTETAAPVSMINKNCLPFLFVNCIYAELFSFILRITSVHCPSVGGTFSFPVVPKYRHLLDVDFVDYDYLVVVVVCRFG